MKVTQSNYCHNSIRFPVDCFDLTLFERVMASKSHLIQHKINKRPKDDTSDESDDNDKVVIIN